MNLYEIVTERIETVYYEVEAESESEARQKYQESSEDVVCSEFEIYSETLGYVNLLEEDI